MNTAAVRGAMTQLALAVPPLLGTKLNPAFLPRGHPNNEKLQDALERAIVHANGAPDATLEPHAFAVVDLTKDARFDLSTTPAYAGWNDNEQKRIASLAKLLALYGAYKLRDDLRTWLTDLSAISSLPALAANIRDEYKLKNAAKGIRPRIEKMFDPNSLRPIDFLRSAKTDSDLAAIHATPEPGCGELHVRHPRARLELDGPLDFELNDLTFLDHLRLMVGWSDNLSASVVVQSLGFFFLWSLTNKAGFWRPSWVPQARPDHGPVGPRGLFLGRDYNGITWMPRDGRPPETPVEGQSNQAGTARSVAVLLTMLAQDRLIDHEAGAGMREMLRKTPHFLGRAACAESSPIGQGMADTGWTAAQAPWNFDRHSIPAWDPNAPLAVSKIGLLDPPFPPVAANALLVRTLRGPATITAVLVGINNLNDDLTPLREFGGRMALELDTLHS